MFVCEKKNNQAQVIDDCLENYKIIMVKLKRGKVEQLAFNSREPGLIFLILFLSKAPDGGAVFFPKNIYKAT